MISTPRNEIQSHHSRLYVILAILSLLLLLSTSCNILNENCNNDGVLDLNQVDCFDVDVSGNGQLESDFFPLRVGTEWTYELVYADYDTASENFILPKEFTFSVTGTQTVEGKRYYIIDNYFIPGSTSLEPTLLRKEGDRVYVLRDSSENLFYSFVNENNRWETPIPLSPTAVLNHFGEVVVLSEGYAVVSWSLYNWEKKGPNPVTGEYRIGSADIFNAGLGRVRIVSVSQWWGLTVWDLKEIKVR